MYCKIPNSEFRIPNYKKSPLRQCLGCREMKPKNELIRAVRSPGGEVSLDFKGKKPGRGAYICQKHECLNRAIKTRALSRAFGMQIPESITEELNARTNARTNAETNAETGE